MSSREAWNTFARCMTIYENLGLSIDTTRMNCPPEFFLEMAPRFAEAFNHMRGLEAGAVANPDENRMVGHYWLRTPALAPSADLQEEISGSVKEIARFAAAVRSGSITTEQGERFENVLVIGIGGSALGPQLVADALWSTDNHVRLFFFDNTDPDGMTRTLAELGGGMNRTLALVISKSGGTVETRNGQLEAAAVYRKRGLDFARHAVAITLAGSKLDQQAESEGWLKRFYIWDWVGGRTSLFSAAGLLPAALQGVDIEGLLEGASRMDEATRAPDVRANPAALLAAMWYWAGNGKGEKDMVILPYKDRLMLFSRYLQQLVMESLGKEKDLHGTVVNQGIAVYGNKGSTDQHAYVQQLREGVNNFFVTFIEVLHDYVRRSGEPAAIEVEPGITSGDYLQGFMLGTRKALSENGRRSLTITIDELNEFTVGGLIALYERAVGLYAALAGINAYHQPGVEAGKKAAAQIIGLQRKLIAALKEVETAGNGSSVAELGVKLNEPDLESIYKILEHLNANPTRGVVRLSQSRRPEEARYGLRK